VHLIVKEEHRQDNFKPKLIMNKDEYESFDEIFERYIAPCNNHMEAIANNKKFTKDRMEDNEKRLKDEKEKDEKIIPYVFCLTEKAP
jgi:transcription elongation factor SPT6